MIRLRPLIPPLLALALLAVACNGGGNKPLFEFIKAVGEANARNESVVQPLQAQLNLQLTAIEPDDPVPVVSGDALEQLLAQEEKFAAELEAIDAPSEGRDVKAEAIGALRAQIEFGESVLAEMNAGATRNDIAAMFQSQDGLRVAERRTAACESLQKLADDNNINAEFNCR